MLKQIFLSLFIITCSQIALGEQTYESDSINIYPVNVSLPKSDGWQLKDRNYLKVVFAKNSTDKSFMAYASLFANKTPIDKDNILEVAKKNIKLMLDVTGSTAITQNHSYTDEFSYPCVKSVVFAIGTVSNESSSNFEIPFQYRFLICVKPEENSGFTAAFSYTSKKSISTLDKEADEFLKGVRFRSAIPDGEINALWNTHDGFGIWIYPETGTCDEIRKRLKSFIVFGPKESTLAQNKSRISLSDIKICLNFDNGKPIAKCDSGYVDMEFDKEKNEYKGYFDISMSNGFVKRGKFRAAYCDGN